MRPFLILLFSALYTTRFLCAQATMPDSLTADDVVRLTLNNNPMIQQAAQDIQAADARIGQAAAMNRPAVDGLASYAHLYPIPEIGAGANTIKIYPSENYDIHLGAHQLVYDFGRTRAQTSVAESRVSSAEDVRAQVSQNLAYQALRAFYAMLFLEESIDVQDQRIAALNQHRALAQRRVESGSATSFDVLTTDVRVASARTQRLDLQTSLNKQAAILRELIGLPSTAPVLVKGLLSDGPTMAPEDSLVSAAMEQRTEMRLARDAKRTARLQRRIADLGKLPSVNALGQVGVKNGYPPDINEWKFNWLAGAQVQVPILDGGRQRSQRAEADAVVRREQEHLQAVERQIRGDISRALADFNAAREGLQIADVRIREAQRAVEIARARDASGTMTNVDVLDAETALAEAELARTQTLFTCEMSRIAVEQAMGVTK
jgi:outer membrane protein TolC